MNRCESCLLHFPGPIQIAYVCRTCRDAAHCHGRADATPEPLSGKGLDPELLQCPKCAFTGNILECLQTLVGPECPECRESVEMGPVLLPPKPRPSANDRLCDAIADVLARNDLTPEARTLIGLALRVQRGEAVDLVAELERRGR